MTAVGDYTNADGNTTVCSCPAMRSTLQPIRCSGRRRWSTAWRQPAIRVSDGFFHRQDKTVDLGGNNVVVLRKVTFGAYQEAQSVAMDIGRVCNWTGRDAHRRLKRSLGGTALTLTGSQ